MWFLPEWAPNLHPLIVHFPIALLFAAAVVDVAGMVFRGRPGISSAAVSLYFFGGLATLASFLAGRAAADSVFLPTEANALLTDHADLGTYTFYFFGVYGLVRLGLHFTAINNRMAIRGILGLVGIAGVGLLSLTATRGAELVFRYGVGVEAVDHSVESLSVAVDSSGTLNSAAISDEKGGWSWRPVRASAWRSSMRFLESPDGLTMSSMIDGGEKGDVLGLTLNGGTTAFVVDQPVTDLQMDASINLDGFEGVIMFIHHAQDSGNYRFTAIGNGEVRQGRSENGDIYLYDQKPFVPDGWVTIRVVSDQSHTRAYAGDTLIAHGHGTIPEPGPVGIRLNGTGTALVDFIRVQTIR